MIVTLDTNFLTSGLIAIEGGTIARIVDAWREGWFEVALSDHLYNELEESFTKSYFTDRVPADSITRYLAFVRSHAVFYPTTAVVVGVATHPEDDLVLASAVSAGAAYLVTGVRLDS